MIHSPKALWLPWIFTSVAEFKQQIYIDFILTGIGFKLAIHVMKVKYFCTLLWENEPDSQNIIKRQYQ